MAQYDTLIKGGCVVDGSGAAPIVADVAISDEMMRGVVRLPHGFGHDRAGTRLAVAREHAGVSLNDLTDESRVDRLTGNAAFSAVPVDVAPA